jgi:hypothetical protein
MGLDWTRDDCCLSKSQSSYVNGPLELELKLVFLLIGAGVNFGWLQCLGKKSEHGRSCGPDCRFQLLGCGDGPHSSSSLYIGLGPSFPI